MNRHRKRWSRRRRLTLITLVALGAVGAAGGPTLARWAGLGGPPAWTAAARARCVDTAVGLAVTPEILDTVNRIVQPVQGSRLRDGNCLRVMVTTRTPQDVVAQARRTTEAGTPQLWIPDSSLWQAQVDRWPLRSEGSFASSPLVIATGASVVVGVGWATRPPSWPEALSGIRPVAMPDLQNNASGVLAVSTAPARPRGWSRCTRAAGRRRWTTRSCGSAQPPRQLVARSPPMPW